MKNLQFKLLGPVNLTIWMELDYVAFWLNTCEDTFIFLTFYIFLMPFQRGNWFNLYLLIFLMKGNSSKAEIRQISNFINCKNVKYFLRVQPSFFEWKCLNFLLATNEAMKRTFNIQTCSNSINFLEHPIKSLWKEVFSNQVFLDFTYL